MNSKFEQKHELICYTDNEHEKVSLKISTVKHMEIFTQTKNINNLHKIKTHDTH